MNIVREFTNVNDINAYGKKHHLNPISIEAHVQKTWYDSVNNFRRNDIIYVVLFHPMSGRIVTRQDIDPDLE